MFPKIYILLFFFIALTSENIFAQEFCTLPYTGKIRAKAKTSISKGKLREYETVGDFLASLPTDGYMRKTGINNNSLRTRDEDMNIFIKNAYIFQLKREEDNDLHVTIGDVVDGKKINLLTIEIAGLPDPNSPDYNTLLEVRKTIYNRFKVIFDSKQKSKLLRKPYPSMSVTGSLFFDNWHYAKNNDPTRPNTVFELHPVIEIKF